MAIVLTAPFATAYLLAYPDGDPLPIWYDAVEPLVQPLLGFGASQPVYATYGRIYNVVYVLFIPTVLVLHGAHKRAPSRLEKAGYAVLLSGLLAATVGVAADYWGDGLGFGVELLGLMLMMIGVTAWGVSLLRARVVPVLWAWLMVVCGPGAAATLFLIGHVPSGPTLSFAIVWLVVGCLILSPGNRTALMGDLNTGL